MPPLNALKAFEAAARHLSFTAASAELNVTQAAISHQVRTLENYLGLNLFNRAHQRLALTNAGKAYLPMLTTSFDLIGQGYKEIITDKTSTHLNIKAPSSFSVQWLLPRIADYQKQHPSIDVHCQLKITTLVFSLMPLILKLGIYWNLASKATVRCYLQKRYFQFAAQSCWQAPSLCCNHPT